MLGYVMLGKVRLGNLCRLLLNYYLEVIHDASNICTLCVEESIKAFPLSVAPEVVVHPEVVAELVSQKLKRKLGLIRCYNGVFVHCSTVYSRGT